MAVVVVARADGVGLDKRGENSGEQKGEGELLQGRRGDGVPLYQPPAAACVN